MPVIRSTLVCILFAVACGGPREADPRGAVDRAARARDEGSAEDRLEAAVTAALDREMAAHPEVRNAVAEVHLLAQDLHVTRAAGQADPAARKRMTPSTPFRIASVTKTMTAVVVMQLVEEGRLSLSDTLERLDGVVAVDRLQVVDGISYGRQITVEQLLRHRSGLPDYFFDGEWRDGATDYLREVFANPTRVRPPVEIAQWVIDHLQPIALPGTTYHYADTNYLLLGLIVESIERKPLPQVYRDRLFSPLGMKDAYLEFYEPTPAGAHPAHMFLLDADIAGVSLGEWGGGGIVATAKDLDRFFAALAQGRLFRSQATLDAMIPDDEVEPGYGYGLGIARYRETGVEFWGHSGFFGSFAWYVPAAGAVVVGTVDAFTPIDDLGSALIAAALEASASRADP
jgi:D-alanyl-D-alanine carboxypeptidase